jgi:hypothetical protein
MTACFFPSNCFSACKTTHELPVTQLARHVDINLFYLVATDSQTRILSFPHGLDPPIKHITHFTQAAAPWAGGGEQPCGLDLNTPFLSARGVVFIWQYLTCTIIFSLSIYQLMDT